MPDIKIGGTANAASERANLAAEVTEHLTKEYYGETTARRK